jgi:hypothetical protein
MMEPFVLLRHEDESGISGTGLVAEGVKFSSGQYVLSWLTIPKGWTRKPVGIGVYEDIDHVKAIHGHNGKTDIEWGAIIERQF